MFDAWARMRTERERVWRAKQIQPTIPTTAEKNHSCHDDNDAAAPAASTAAVTFFAAPYTFFDYGESFNIEPNVQETVQENCGIKRSMKKLEHG